MFRLIRALEELARAINRAIDYLEAQDQDEINQLTSRLRQANARAAKAIDRIRKAVASQPH